MATRQGHGKSESSTTAGLATASLLSLQGTMLWKRNSTHLLVLGLTSKLLSSVQLLA